MISMQKMTEPGHWAWLILQSNALLSHCSRFGGQRISKERSLIETYVLCTKRGEFPGVKEEIGILEDNIGKISYEETKMVMAERFTRNCIKDTREA